MSNSDGELGTLRITIRLPSVEPIPIDANERTDDASENKRGDPSSVKTYDPDLTRWANCGDISIFGLENVNDGSTVLNDFAFGWFFDLMKLADGVKNGLAADPLSSLSFSPDRITNFLFDDDLWMPLACDNDDGLFGFGDCFALNVISLSPYFGVSVGLSYKAFVCESIT